MKKSFIFGLIFLALFSCQKPQKKVDITARAFLAGEEISLKVTLVSPVGAIEGWREAFKILVGFNQAMTALQSIPRDQTEGPLEFEPPIKGKYRWLGTRTLSFIPNDTLAPATEFKVILRKDKIQSLTGKRLERDTSWTFESTRPTLLRSLPSHGSEFTDLKSSVYLNFNLEMVPERIGDRIKIFATQGMPSKVWCGEKKLSFSTYKEEIHFTARLLKDEEKKGWPLSDWDSKKTLVLCPVRPLPAEAEIEVNLEPGLLSKTGNLGLSTGGISIFRTYNFLSILNHSGEIAGGEPLKLCFSNPVVISEVVMNMTIEPPVEIPEEYKEETYDVTQVHLYLSFKPNSEYKIKLDKKLKDLFGNNLDKTYEFILSVGDYSPHAEIPTEINIVESKADLRVPATFVNVDSVYLEMGLVDLELAIPFLNQSRLFNADFRYETPGFFKVSRFWNVNTFRKYRNKVVRLPLELKWVLGEKKSGLVFTQFDNLRQNRYRDRYLKSFLAVGDLGVTWKYSPENNLVWVTSLYSTAAIKKAKVQFRDDKNRVLSEGFTDNAGFCELPGWVENRLTPEKSTYESEHEMYSYNVWDEPKLWLTVSKGEDQAIYSNKWNFGIDLWRFDISYNWNITPEEYDSYIFTEKGLYRSGETVHVKGILRKKKKGEWILPDLNKIVFIVKNSRDEEIINDTLLMNSFGAFFKDISLIQDAPTGIYSIRVILPQKEYNFLHDFRVEAYRPAEFEVKTFAERDTFIAGENFKGRIEARYLFGMPMKQADVEWHLLIDDYELSYPKYSGYSFGRYDREERASDMIGSGQGRLDEEGKYSIQAKLSSKSIKMPSMITLEGTITAPNKRILSGRQNWLTFPANILVGLKFSSYLYSLGDTVKLDLITIRPSGEKIGNKKVNLKIVKQEWTSIKKARLGGRYEWVSQITEKEIKKEEVWSRLDSKPIKFVPKEPGYFYVLARSKDEKGRDFFTKTYFYVAGKGYAGWEMRDDDIIELVPDKVLYEVGDTARILVKSPYDSAHALVTVERELILRKFTTKLHGNADYIEVPIKSIDLPNIYVCVTLLRGRVEGLTWDEEKQEDLGKPQFKLGYVDLKVDTKQKHLMVKTRSNKSDYRPRDSITVYFEVKDHRGNPVKNSEVSLFVVDLGVLNLIDYRTPNPFDHFYGPRSLSVKTVESRLNILGERSYAEKGEDRGGGGMDQAGILYREKFLSTAYYKGDLRTDGSGNGKASFVLPDNLTKFRIMVVAQTRNSEFGSAESTFVVNLPFIISPSIPRFIRLGDKFNAGIVLHNRTSKEDKAQVECEVEGLRLIGDNKKEVSLPPNSSKEVLFAFSAQAIGNGMFKFNARMGNEKDGMKLTMPVKLPPFVEAVATFSSTTDSALEAMIVPSNIYEKIGNLEALLSSSVLAGMRNGIEHLLDYPYGCLEQRLSSVLPLIVGEDIINKFELAPVTGKPLRDTVQKVIEALPAYQTYDGGFLYFKDSRSPCPYLCAYTMYVLKRAYDDGYRIDPLIIENGKKFLKAVLRWDNVDWTYPYNEYARLTTQAFCLYSLSLWGEKEAGYASKLFDHREQMSVFGKTLLLKAGRNLGMGSNFENELVRIITDKIKLSATTAHFEESELRGWTFPSPAKVTGFVIQTFTELDIPFAYKDQAIRWLVQERGKKTMPTTHENAFIFDALQTYYRKFESEEPDFVAHIILDQKEILRETFKGRTNESPKQFTFILDDMPRDRLLPVKISKQGTGRLYYTLRMSYAFKENPAIFDEGFYVWKELLTLDGNEVKKFKRGKVYKVILHIVVPETRIFAVVNDPLPAGLEPVQTYFATESRKIQERMQQEEAPETGHWWGGFDHKEFYDDKVLFFAQELFPGEHTEVYFVKAGTSGEFLAPATKAEEMYSPEVFGSTSQGYITVE